jgi:hypothetical protein
MCLQCAGFLLLLLLLLMMMMTEFLLLLHHTGAVPHTYEYMCISINQCCSDVACLAVRSGSLGHCCLAMQAPGDKQVWRQILRRHLRHQLSMYIRFEWAEWAATKLADLW